MPATRTCAQQSQVPYAYSSSSKSSVLDRRTPFPYIQIPKIPLLDYRQLLSDEDTFDEVMATIGHWWSLVNQSKTIQHLWLTSRRLLEEVDRQRHEAQRIFTRMEQMGLQQELYGSRFTALPVWGRSEWSTPSVSPLSTQPSYSSLSSQPSQFHSCEETVINDNLSDYHESEAPLASLSSLPLPPLERSGILLLSTMTKMISTGCSVCYDPTFRGYNRLQVVFFFISPLSVSSNVSTPVSFICFTRRFASIPNPWVHFIQWCFLFPFT
jgi:hypothetical protein